MTDENTINHPSPFSYALPTNINMGVTITINIPSPLLIALEKLLKEMALSERADRKARHKV